MRNRIIEQLLSTYETRTIQDIEKAFREIIQKIVLVGLSRSDFFSKASFYGGTCLRIFYHLERFSEDLDFAANKENVSFDKYEPYIFNELKSFGFDSVVSKKDGVDMNMIDRRYVKINLLSIMNDYYPFSSLSFNKDKVLSVKVELDKEVFDYAKTEIKYLYTPVIANIACYDLSSLFAGKIAALLNRNWKNRIKGRDFYDYLFYIRNGVSFNLNYLANKMGKDGLTLDKVKTMLLNKFNEVDMNLVKKDITQFIDDIKLIEFDKDAFINSLSILNAN